MLEPFGPSVSRLVALPRHKERARHLCWSCPVLQTTPSQTEFSIVPHNVTKFRRGVCRSRSDAANSDLGFFRKLWLTVLQRFCSRFVMVSTQSFDVSGDIPNWTTSCYKAAVTTDRVNSRDLVNARGGPSRGQRVSARSLCAALFWRLLQIRHTRANIVKLRTACERMATPLATLPHEVSTWTRTSPTWTRRGKTVAIDPHSCSKRASQLLAPPSGSTACDGLL